jgi:type IV pilus assembly protein PilM
LQVREMVDSAMMQAGAVTASVPRGWLAGVRGALRN